MMQTCGGTMVYLLQFVSGTILGKMLIIYQTYRMQEVVGIR